MSCEQSVAPKHARCPDLGAEDGTRTRDPDLGKVVLYQLSHFRIYGSNEPNQSIELTTPSYWKFSAKTI